LARSARHAGLRTLLGRTLLLVALLSGARLRVTLALRTLVRARCCCSRSWFARCSRCCASTLLRVTLLRVALLRLALLGVALWRRAAGLALLGFALRSGAVLSLRRRLRGQALRRDGTLLRLWRRLRRQRLGRRHVRARRSCPGDVRSCAALSGRAPRSRACRESVAPA
jgi:hypothetical protein